ncbi:MAG: glycosyl hydrolase [Deltaproteobacteria bacterium]|nr:glycosyl hydrolase [Deltaproteobacteria bacterium]
MRVGAVICGFLVACSGDDDDRIRLYHAEPKAPGLSDDAIAALDHLGPTIFDSGVNFGVYSRNATRLDLLLFEDPDAELPTRQYEMVRFGDVWNLFIEGIGPGMSYGFVAWGPNWPEHPDFYPGSIHGFLADVGADGSRFNPNKLLFDPWGKVLHRDHDWSRGSLASGPARTESTYAAAAKSVVWKSAYEWSTGPNGEEAWRQMRRTADAPGHRWNDLIIYEVHPKGFTASPASGVDHPGTFRGIGEKADYLADLGITAVELLPVHEKPLDGGYWGYATLSFFAPELSYAAAKRPEEVLDEFKWMVDELHQRGIEVLVDVVYNHTGEGGLWREKLLLDDVILDSRSAGQLVNFDPKEVTGLYAYRGLDNAEYYALTPDGQFYWNNTGVGNQTRPNHRPMRRLILDSLRFYASELHVDGFRFDLAPVLGERDADYDKWDDPSFTVLQDIIDDPVLREHNTRIIAEPWSLGPYGVKIGDFPAATSGDGVGWYEWNGRFRDWWRAFLNNDGWRLNSLEGDADGGFTMTGSIRYYDWNGRRPYHGVNFVTVHDGFTLYDVFSYDEKQNNCGPLNPLCCTEPLSAWCDIDSGEDNNRSRNWGQASEGTKRALMRDAFAALMISHGTPMILGGDEWMRTQLGNNNAYSTLADNSYNWFDWGSWQASDERYRMRDFVKQMVRLRKEHAYALAPAAFGAGASFRWRSPSGTDPDWKSRALMIHYDDPMAGPELLILINLERDWRTYTLPTGRSWARLVDTQEYLDAPAYFDADPDLDRRRTANASLDSPVAISGATYGAAPNSIVILRAR